MKTIKIQKLVKKNRLSMTQLGAVVALTSLTPAFAFEKAPQVEDTLENCYDASYAVAKADGCWNMDHIIHETEQSLDCKSIDLVGHVCEQVNSCLQTEKTAKEVIKAMKDACHIQMQQ